MVWILLSALILAIIIALAGIYIWKLQKGKMLEPDYYVFFTMGLVWLPLGFVFMFAVDGFSFGPLFVILGAAYLAIGLKNKDKWHKPRKTLPPDRAKIKLAVLMGLVLTLLVGFVFLIRFA